jgi:hypothetical protein
MRPTPQDIQRFDARKFYTLVVFALIMIAMIVAQTVFGM